MSEIVLGRVRTWISSSGLTEGGRLPPERDLCRKLGITRTELRKALLMLEAGGSLVRQVGRGTFLAKTPHSPKSGSSESTISELAERTGPHEAMMARLALEPELARLAALHATPRHLRELRRLSNAMRSAASWRSYEDMDSEFHDIIADASGNSLLHELHKILNGVRLVVVWRRLSTPEVGPDPNYHSFDEHDAIVSALEGREGKLASKAMQSHLQSTLSTMTVDS